MKELFRQTHNLSYFLPLEIRRVKFRFSPCVQIPLLNHTNLGVVGSSKTKLATKPNRMEGSDKQNTQ